MSANDSAYTKESRAALMLGYPVRSSAVSAAPRPRATRLVSSLASAALVAASVLGVLAAAPANAATVTGSAVSADAQGLLLNGQRWWPAGVNAYELATNWSINAGCGAQVNLDSFFGSQPANSLVRFDAFQSMAINKSTGLLDYSAIDAVFAAAAKYHQYVIPVLSGQWGSCEDGIYKQKSWYQSGWTQLNTASARVMSFQSWVTAAVKRWQSSPALAGWELVGEPEDQTCANTKCTTGPTGCPSDASNVLRSWMDTAGTQVRNLDHAHLIFAGFLGGGQCGTAGPQFQTVSASPGVDVVEYHDYGADGVALPGDQWNGLAVHLQQAKAVGKPLLVAEVGENAGSCEPLATRVTHVQQKLTGQRAAGTAGILAWDWVPDPRLDQCTYDVGPSDPLLPMLASFNTLG